MALIRTDQPKVKVLLTKVIRYRNGTAERYTAANTQFDLTPFLGDQGTVFTYKKITEPMGTFQITLTDRLHEPSADSLYGLISPMDHIEIRMAREPWRYVGDELPIVMRGFVSTVKRSQSMSGDGRPVRAVVIQGQDYGKLLSILQIFYERNYGLGQNLLTTFKLSENFAVTSKAYPSAEFMTEVITKIVNPELKKLFHASALASTLKQVLAIKPRTSVYDGTIQPYSFEPYQGSVWGLMRLFADTQWNELFIDDEPDGVYLVYRPMPFKDSAGQFIQPGSEPGTTVIDLDDIKSIDVSRSDDSVANYFWVQAPRAQLARAGDLQNDAYSKSDDYFLQNHPNCTPTLYGIRKMEVQTEQAATLEDSAGVHLLEQQQQKANARMDEWVHLRRQRLVAYNKDNVLFEHGDISVKGNETLRAGQYLRIDHGVFAADYYVTGVAQTFRPYQSYETKLNVVRGTGFIERTRLAQSPYLAERGGGVYD